MCAAQSETRRATRRRRRRGDRNPPVHHARGGTRRERAAAIRSTRGVWRSVVRRKRVAGHETRHTRHTSRSREIDLGYAARRCVVVQNGSLATKPASIGPQPNS